MFRHRRLLVLALIWIISESLVAEAGDWPQFRGPKRDGHAAPQKLLRQWPTTGPQLLWTAEGLGAGYSGLAVVGDRIVTMGLIGEDEMVLSRRLSDGQEIWRTRIGPAYRQDIGDGPRSTPTVVGDAVFALGASGDLACLDLNTGQIVWHRQILKEFDASNITWGISESPLVVGQHVIVTPGGRKGTMVALDKISGATLWTAKDPRLEVEPAGYASPILYSVAGNEQVATFTSLGAFAVRLRDGKFVWRYDKVANGTANIATPVYSAGHLFYSSDYGQGCALLRLQGDRVQEVYFNKNLKNHHGGVVAIDGHLYGFDSSVLVCVEMASGKQKWKDRSVGKGSLSVADGMLYLLSEDGVVGLVRPSPTKYEEVSRFSLPSRSDQRTWTYPVIAHGRLLLRDQDRLFCYHVKAE